MSAIERSEAEAKVRNLSDCSAMEQLDELFLYLEQNRGRFVESALTFLDARIGELVKSTSPDSDTTNPEDLVFPV